VNKSTKNVIKTIFFIAFGVGLFAWTIQSVGLNEIIGEIKNANFFWVGLALISGILSHWSRAVRWKILIKPLGHQVNTWNSFHSVIFGYLVNMAVPRLGEITRPGVMSKMENISFNQLIGTVLAERVVDMIMTILIGIAILFIQFSFIADTLKEIFGSYADVHPALLALIAITPIAIAFILFLKRKALFQGVVMQKIKGFLMDLFAGFKTIFVIEHKGIFIFHTFFIWLMYFFMPFFILKSLDATAHLGVSAGLTVLLFGTAAVIIPVPGGIGTFHFLVPLALTLYEINELSGKTYATLTHAIQTVVILVVGIFSAIYIFVKLNQQKRNEHTSAN
jgi:uncharacterized protein (TIRG00374 family)